MDKDCEFYEKASPRAKTKPVFEPIFTPPVHVDQPTPKKEKVPVGDVNEKEVVFKAISDLKGAVVQTQDGSQNIMEITGYDLNIKFNLDLLNSVQDVENMLMGVTDIFRKEVMDCLVKKNKQVIQK